MKLFWNMAFVQAGLVLLWLAGPCVAQVSKYKTIPTPQPAQKKQAVATKQTASKKRKAPKKLRFRLQQLHKDFNEGCAVGDINNDGHLDVTAGAFCYMGPEFKQYPLRRLLPFRDDYMENNGEHLVLMSCRGHSCSRNFSGMKILGQQPRKMTGGMFTDL